ncbi:MAG: hypothetical protein Q8S44_09310 [Flavobacteriaceae bacterium]|nr:hypothetical protein [Flavobacteriaceae bacterium]
MKKLQQITIILICSIALMSCASKKGCGLSSDATKIHSDNIVAVK